MKTQPSSQAFSASGRASWARTQRPSLMRKESLAKLRFWRVAMIVMTTHLPPGQVRPHPHLRMKLLKCWSRTASHGQPTVRKVRLCPASSLARLQYGTIRHLRGTLLTTLKLQSPCESILLRPTASFEGTRSRHCMQKTIVEQAPEHSVARVMTWTRYVFRRRADVAPPLSTASRAKKRVLNTTQHSSTKMTRARLSSRIDVDHRIWQEISPSISFEIM